MLNRFKVYGLRRKERNGTAFYIQADGNPMKGWAHVVRTVKGHQHPKFGQGDLVLAQLQVSGTTFSFHSKDKQSWPDAPKPTGVKVWKSKTKKK